MYNKSLYNDYAYLKAHCTDKMLKKLQDKYDSFIFEELPDTNYRIIGYTGNSENITIPGYFNNKNPAGQIWASVMKSMHKDLPGRQFAVPSKIETVEICPITGLLASGTCKDTYLEYYIDGALPVEVCSDHSNIKENIIEIEPETLDTQDVLNGEVIDTTFEQ